MGQTGFYEHVGIVPDEPLCLLCRMDPFSNALPVEVAPPGLCFVVTTFDAMMSCRSKSRSVQRLHNRTPQTLPREPNISAAKTKVSPETEDSLNLPKRT